MVEPTTSTRSTPFASSLRRQQQSGFSLVELLLVIAILLVVLSIALPEFRRARIGANEASAVESMHAIVVAQYGYTTTYPQSGFAATLTQLGPPPGSELVGPDHAGVLDETLGCPHQPCTRTGYAFAIAGNGQRPWNSYNISAIPTSPGGTGDHSFCSDEKGVVMSSTDPGLGCGNVGAR